MITVGEWCVIKISIITLFVATTKHTPHIECFYFAPDPTFVSFLCAVSGSGVTQKENNMTTNEYETMLQESKRKHGRRKVDIPVNAYKRLQELNNLMIEKYDTHDISLSDTVEIAIYTMYHDLVKE